MTREIGYYWVMADHPRCVWQVALWDGAAFYIAGGQCQYPGNMLTVDERRIVRGESKHVVSNDTELAQQLSDTLAALQNNLGSLESEICNADLRLAEMDSSQRELLRRRECAGERVRIVFAEIQEVEAKINAIKASKEGTK